MADATLLLPQMALAPLITGSQHALCWKCGQDNTAPVHDRGRSAQIPATKIAAERNTFASGTAECWRSSGRRPALPLSLGEPRHRNGQASRYCRSSTISPVSSASNVEPATTAPSSPDLIAHLLEPGHQLAQPLVSLCRPTIPSLAQRRPQRIRDRPSVAEPTIPRRVNRHAVCSTSSPARSASSPDHRLAVLAPDHRLA